MKGARLGVPHQVGEVVSPDEDEGCHDQRPSHKEHCADDHQIRGDAIFARKRNRDLVAKRADACEDQGGCEKHRESAEGRWLVLPREDRGAGENEKLAARRPRRDRRYSAHERALPAYRVHQAAIQGGLDLQSAAPSPRGAWTRLGAEALQAVLVDDGSSSTRARGRNLVSRRRPVPYRAWRCARAPEVSRSSREDEAPRLSGDHLIANREPVPVVAAECPDAEAPLGARPQVLVLSRPPRSFRYMRAGRLEASIVNCTGGGQTSCLVPLHVDVPRATHRVEMSRKERRPAPP